MKKWLIIIFVLVILIILVLIFFRGLSGEDDWIKDSKGIWIKHGNPLNIPLGVADQQMAIICSGKLYENAKEQGIQFDSQCLGSCSDYSVDIVHVPRIADDDNVSNQCDDFKNGITHKFIELDSKGTIVRVVD